MSLVAPLSAGGFQPTTDRTTGVTGNFGASRAYRDGIFIKTRWDAAFSVKQRIPHMALLNVLGKKMPIQGKPGERYPIRTLSMPAVGPYTDNITTNSFTYPEYVGTDAPTFGGTKFMRTATAGTTVLGIGFPLQAPNEGEAELFIDQYTGCAMLFTQRFLQTSVVRSPDKEYIPLMRSAMDLDAEFYAQLVCLYTGPLTEVAGAYGTQLNDAIGITNQTNYQLTRTLTAINSGSNLITPTTTGVFGGAMTGTSRWLSVTGGRNVPYLVGNPNQGITINTFRQMNRVLAGEFAPDSRVLVVDPSKGYFDIINIPEAVNADVNRAPLSTNTSTPPKARFQGFDIHTSGAIRPMGASSNVYYGVAGIRNEGIAYGFQQEPDTVIDNRMDKSERCVIASSVQRYGMVGGPRVNELIIVPYAA